MLMTLPKTSIEFLDSDHENWWCRDGDIRAYLYKRMGMIYVPNIYNSNRSENCYRVADPLKSGKFHPFMDMLEQAARERSYRAIVIEGVTNEFLPDVLIRRGYVYTTRWSNINMTLTL